MKSNDDLIINQGVTFPIIAKNKGNLNIALKGVKFTLYGKNISLIKTLSSLKTKKFPISKYYVNIKSGKILSSLKLSILKRLEMKKLGIVKDTIQNLNKSYKTSLKVPFIIKK